jgi:exosortase/archaeosortase family protein
VHTTGLLKRWTPVAFIVVAVWPVWIWYVARMVDRSDEPWGLLALSTAAVHIAIRGRSPAEPLPTRLPWILLAAYAATFPFVPPIFRAALAVTAIGSAASSAVLGRRFHPGLSALLVLSLPVVPSLQFFLGYPLRVVVAKVASLLVRLTGFAACSEGASITWAGRDIMVDAPCSGVRMLWAALFVAATASALLDLDVKRSAYAGAVTVLAVLLGNVFRAAALFYIEAGLVEAPRWTHSGVGVVAFAAVVAIVLAVSGWLSRKEDQCRESQAALRCA